MKDEGRTRRSGGRSPSSCHPSCLHPSSLIFEVVGRLGQERAELLLVVGLFVGLFGRDAQLPRRCSMMASSRGWLPFFLPTWIMPGIWWVLPSRTRLAMALSKTSTSRAATRPGLSMRRKRFCATTPLSDSAKRGAHLILLAGGEHVDDAVHRLGGAGGVQRAENEVARGGGGQGEFDGFEVAHFPDEDDVRVLAQRAAQGGGEGFRVDAHLAVVDQRLLALVDELDGVFHRDDVVLPVQVGVVDHRGERGRFAGAGRVR